MLVFPLTKSPKIDVTSLIQPDPNYPDDSFIREDLVVNVDNQALALYVKNLHPHLHGLFHLLELRTFKNINNKNYTYIGGGLSTQGQLNKLKKLISALVSEFGEDDDQRTDLTAKDLREIMEDAWPGRKWLSRKKDPLLLSYCVSDGLSLTIWKE